MSLPDIYIYNDFKQYLRDVQIERNKTDISFNKSNISKLLGLPNTRSFFSEVISGRRPVTPAFIERFIILLDLNKEEALYFRALIRYNQAENSGDRELYFDQLLSLNKTPKMVLAKETYSYFKEWHHNVIRALLDIIDVSDDYKEIAKKVYPRITVKKAKESIQLLETLQLIAKNEKGFYKPTSKAVTTPEYIRNELVLHYQIGCLEMAQELALRRTTHPRHIYTNTISISKNGYEQLQNQMEKFRSQVRAVVHKDEDPADSIYQICLTALPITDRN